MPRSLIAASTALVLAVSLAAFARAPLQAPPAQGAAPAPSAGQVRAWVATLSVGSKWDMTKVPQQQVGFPDHVAGVTKLASEGKLLVGGPFLESPDSPKVTGAMWIVQAENADAAKKLVETDPWVKGELLKIESVRAFFAAGGSWLAAKPAASPAK
jgi:uncharacterized protein YciI